MMIWFVLAEWLAMTRNLSCRHGQQGMTLISLMVGLLLSMISILAAFTLYKSLVQVSIESRTDALQDGQLASAMLSLQLEVQSAGYGIASDEPGTHVQLVAGPPQTLYWRYKEAGATFVCRGFQIQDVENNTRRRLQLLALPAANCNASGVLSSLPNWAVSTVLAEFRASEAAGASLPAIAITLAAQECFPYGMGEAAEHQMVTITADNAARRAAVDEGTAAPNAPVVHSFCLPNL